MTAQVTVNAATPLVVDMDGTFFSSDSTSLMHKCLWRRRPHRALGARRLRRAGDKAGWKLYLLRHGEVAVERFEPYVPLHAWLEQHRDRRPRVLATGAPEVLAEAVSRAWPGLFDFTVGTTPGVNLTGPRKSARLVELFGERGFDYAGNSLADLAVWTHARRAIVVNPEPGVAEAAHRVCEVEVVL